MPGRMEFEFQLTKPQISVAFRGEGEDQMRILILGDFSARESRGVIGDNEALASRTVLPVDVDTFSTLFQRFPPELPLWIDGPDDPAESLKFERLEDFHTGTMYEKLGFLGPLRELRKRLADPSTFQETAAELKRRIRELPPLGVRGGAPAPGADPAGKSSGSPGGIGSGGPAGTGSIGPAGFGSGGLAGIGADGPAGIGADGPAGFGAGGLAGIGAGGLAGIGANGPSGSPSTPEDDVAILERLFGKRPAGMSPPSGSGSPPVDISNLLEKIVSPHVKPAADPEQARLVASLDDAIAHHLRRVLHHPPFQVLEAVWRGLYWLVANIETDEDLRIFVLDVSKEELASNLLPGGDLERSALYRTVVGGGAHAGTGRPWSLLVGAYAFGPGSNDVHLLAALGALASRAGGPFLGAARPEVVGCRSFAKTPDPTDWPVLQGKSAEDWGALRKSPWAPWIGLALPRFLLRLPYGAKTDAVEHLRFEEMVDGGRTEKDYLWGNPAFACARLIAEAFRENGPSMQPGDFQEVGDLPAHTYSESGEAMMQACAEAFLGERAASAIIARGLMLLVSLRNRNAVRLARFQSIADPPAPLSGPWE